MPRAWPLRQAPNSRCAAMSRLSDTQVRFNAASRDAWDQYSSHRKVVTEILTAGVSPGPSRLCVLGAGNCNDLDLAALLAVHREVHLVDLDAEALAHGVERQGRADNPAVRCHGGLDVTGVLNTLAAWS